MFNLNDSMRYWLYPFPTDMRKGFYTLSGLVTDQLGINLPPPTVNDWFKDTADLLRPLYYRLKEQVLATDYIQVDETTVPVINNEKHKTVNGYMWMVRSVMDKQLFFHYDHGSRAQNVALSLLKDFRGALQTDGYSVYKIHLSYLSPIKPVSP